MSEEIKKLIELLKDPNHIYIYNCIDDIKKLNSKIEHEKKKPFSDMEPADLPSYDRRHNEANWD